MTRHVWEDFIARLTGVLSSFNNRAYADGLLDGFNYPSWQLDFLPEPISTRRPPPNIVPAPVQSFAQVETGGVLSMDRSALARDKSKAKAKEPPAKATKPKEPKTKEAKPKETKGKETKARGKEKEGSASLEAGNDVWGTSFDPGLHDWMDPEVRPLVFRGLNVLIV
jgi:hypothetical protein